jgi:hypothetical protein
MSTADLSAEINRMMAEGVLRTRIIPVEVIQGQRFEAEFWIEVRSARPVAH